MPDNKLTNDQKAAKEQAIRDHYYLPAPDGRYRTKAGVAAKVIGIGIGPKLKGGTPTGQTSVRFYVERKIKPLEAIHERFRIKNQCGGLPTDVIEVGRFASFDYKPAPGSSICLGYQAPNVEPGVPGTFGAVVRMNDKLYALGSNHVMKVNGRVPMGVEILFVQPGEFMDDPARNVMARTSVHVQLIQNSEKPNHVDCALAEIVTGRVEAELPRAYEVKSAEILDPEPLMSVARVDESENATGMIEEINVRARIDYRFGTFDFDDLVLIKGNNRRFGRAGDSGALVLGRDKNDKWSPTALVVGGNQNYTLACPLRACLDELEKALAGLSKGKESFEVAEPKLELVLETPVVTPSAV